MKALFVLLFSLNLSSCICDPENKDAEKKREVKVASLRWTNGKNYY